MNCSHVAGASHCIKGTKANAEDGEISQIRQQEPPGIRPISIRMACPEEISRCVINTKDFHKLGDLSQVAESVTSGLIVAAKKIDIEDVFPGSSTHGARLDLAQTDVAQGEDAEGLEKRAGQVF